MDQSLSPYRLRCFTLVFNRLAMLITVIALSSSMLPGVRAEILSPDTLQLLQGGLSSWKIKPSETTEIETAPGYGHVIWKDESESVLVAAGCHSEGGRIVAFADVAFFHPENSTDENARAAILNCMRWAAGSRTPVIGFPESLSALADEIGKAGVKTRILSYRQLVDQVDVYCLAGSPEEAASEESRDTLSRFLRSGKGLVVAGGGNEEYTKLVNSIISRSGVRYSGQTEKSKRPILLALAAVGNSQVEGVSISSQPGGKTAAPTGSAMTIGGAVTPSGLVYDKPEITLPLAAEGPLGAALQLINEPGERDNASLIERLRGGADLSGDELAKFQEALYQLNLTVGPIIPTKEDPVIPGENLLVDVIMEIETGFNDSLPPEQIRKIPAADDFPGEVSDEAARVSKSIAIDVNYKGWLPRNNGGGARADEWRPTGLYAPPGEVVRVSVPANLADKGLKVRIGAYGGVLSERWTKLQRYRRLTRNFPIESKTTLAANGFGGIITILIPRRMKGDEPDWREIQIEGAVESPLYVYGQTDEEGWDEIRKYPGPWAELASDRMILTVPSESIRSLRNPAEVMELWNEVVEYSATLGHLDRKLYRAERIVFDRQLSNPGVALHAGQPVAGHIGRPIESAITPELMRSPRSWGFLHELGHVHQDAAWNLPGSIEASCNLWSVYISEELLGVPRAEAHRTTAPLTRRNAMNTYFRNGANFQSDWNGATALESYLQIQEAFGWEAYRDFLATYQDYDDPKRWDDQQERNDQYVERMSEICGVDLTPFYRTWGLSVSDRTAAKTGKLPEWEEDPVKKFRK